MAIRSNLPVGNHAHFPGWPLSDPPTQTPVVWSPAMKMILMSEMIRHEILLAEFICLYVIEFYWCKNEKPWLTWNGQWTVGFFFCMYSGLEWTFAPYVYLEWYQWCGTKSLHLFREQLIWHHFPEMYSCWLTKLMEKEIGSIYDIKSVFGVPKLTGPSVLNRSFKQFFIHLVRFWR